MQHGNDDAKPDQAACGREQDAVVAVAGKFHRALLLACEIARLIYPAHASRLLM
jgi:hypothetical protein